MMQGITALPGAQQQNPGQAAPAQVMPPQQGGIAAPITGALEKLPPQQLLSMYNNPQDMTPKWAVATAYAKAVEQARLMQMAQGQSAMAQNQAQSQQPPVAQQMMMQPVPETQFARHGGIMHGYAGGGAVAFSPGGSTSPIGRWFENLRGKFSEDAEKSALMQQVRNKYATQAAPMGVFMSQSDEERRQAQDIMSRLPSMSKQEMLELLGQRPPVAPGTENYSHEGQVGLASKPVPPVPYVPVVPEAQKDTRQIPPSEVRASAPAGPARPSAARPTGIAAIPAAAPASSAESELAAAMKKLEASEQKAYEEAAVLPPKLIEARDQQELAREAGSKRRREIEQRRLSDIQSQEEELKKGQGLGALDNPLLMMAIASRAGGKNIGDVLRGGVAGGYEEASRQQKDFRDRMDKLRAERLGVDQITIANMDYDAATQELKVAQLTGDRDKMNAAKTKLLEAQRHLLEVQQRDVGSQRQTQIAREQMANAIKVAQIGAAARESATSLAEQRLAIQAMRADPSYAGIVKELAEAKKLAGVSNSPTFQARLRAAETAAKQLAQQYGVTSMTMGMGAGAEVPAASSAAAPPGFGKAVEVKG